MADGPIMHTEIEIKYYISSDIEPILYSGGAVSQGSTIIIVSPVGISYFYPSIPPHMTFKGWYSPLTGTTIDMNTETSFDTSNVTVTAPFIVYAKWDINTKFNYKDKILFDFSQGGVNVVPEALSAGVTAYNADGILISGSVSSLEGVSF